MNWSYILKEVLKLFHCVHFKLYELLGKAEECADLHFYILGLV